MKTFTFQGSANPNQARQGHNMAHELGLFYAAIHQASINAQWIEFSESEYRTTTRAQRAEEGSFEKINYCYESSDPETLKFIADFLKAHPFLIPYHVTIEFKILDSSYDFKFTHTETNTIQGMGNRNFFYEDIRDALLETDETVETDESEVQQIAKAIFQANHTGKKISAYSKHQQHIYSKLDQIESIVREFDKNVAAFFLSKPTKFRSSHANSLQTYYEQIKTELEEKALITTGEDQLEAINDLIYDLVDKTIDHVNELKKKHVDYMNDNKLYGNFQRNIDLLIDSLKRLISGIITPLRAIGDVRRGKSLSQVSSVRYVPFASLFTGNGNWRKSPIEQTCDRAEEDLIQHSDRPFK